MILSTYMDLLASRSDSCASSPISMSLFDKVSSFFSPIFLQQSLLSLRRSSDQATTSLNEACLFFIKVLMAFLSVLMSSAPRLTGSCLDESASSSTRTLASSIVFFFVSSCSLVYIIPSLPPSERVLSSCVTSFSRKYTLPFTLTLFRRPFFANLLTVRSLTPSSCAVLLIVRYCSNAITSWSMYDI